MDGIVATPEMSHAWPMVGSFKMGLESMDRMRLAQKVEWEGGVLAAMEYGIHAEQIDDGEVRRVWDALERAYRELTPLVDRINSLLRPPESI